MYKLIIVDDEFGSAKAMSKFVDYEKFNFTVAGVFASAEQALKFIEENSIDLLISDIKMQGMNGIELLKAVNKRFPRIKVVLISAYRDFEYAKEAVSNNAFDYITKPVSYAEFTGVLQRVKEIFEMRDSIAISDIDIAVELQEKVLGYFNSNTDISELAEYLAGYASDTDITKSSCSIININIPDITDFFASRWKHGSEKFLHAIKQIIPTNMNGIIFSFLSGESNNIRIIAVDVDGSEDYKKRVDAFISHINYEIFMVFGLNVDSEVINTANSLSELKKNGVNSTMKMFNLMMFYIGRREMNTLSELVEDFFEFKKIDDWHSLCNLLTCEVVKRGDVNNEINIDEIGIQCINSCEILKEYACTMLNRLGAKLTTLKNNTLLKVISYISSRYSEDLSLNSIANHIGFNSSYVSHYFKQEMKESYSNFIVKVRMENAKKLLRNEPDLKINNIVTLVGYESQPYFYKAFRKYEGCLPSEYRIKE